MDIKGKTAVVTGSSSDEGIGSECAKILASRGCNVVVNYATNKTGGDAIVAACKAAGGDAILVQGDVSKDADCQRLVQAALEKWGRLDVLVNNAATTKPIPHRRMDLLSKQSLEKATPSPSEPPRVCRRLQLLRGWSHGQAAKAEVST